MSVNRTTIQHLIDAAHESGSDDSMLDNLISVFQNATRVRVEQLGMEIEHGNYKVASQLAHVIKASAANLGALDLAELCQSIEDAVNTRTKIDWNSTYAKVITEYNSTMQELSQMSSTYRH